MRKGKLFKEGGKDSYRQEFSGREKNEVKEISNASSDLRSHQEGTYGAVTRVQLWRGDRQERGRASHQTRQEKTGVGEKKGRSSPTSATVSPTRELVYERSIKLAKSVVMIFQCFEI